MAEQQKSRSAKDYGVGWIAAIPLERACAEVMLDEEHDEPEDFQQHATDQNSYTWGRTSGHNVVIASLPPTYGTISSSQTALGMRASFPDLKFALLVGIAAGTPSSQNDIRLGDVVVSQPQGTSTGVVQYDLVKAKGNNQFELKGVLSPPVNALLHAVTNLQAKHIRKEPKMIELLGTAAEDNPVWAKNVRRPDSKSDRLFAATYTHLEENNENCRQCNVTQIQPRVPRESSRPRIFYGTIASGNTLVKDGLHRNQIHRLVGPHCCCIEMEAAGVMNSLPCIVIRGICDYADSHKNDQWQGYAAAVAAAYAKELLTYARVSDIATAQPIQEQIRDVKSELIQIKTSLQHARASRHESKASQFLQALYVCPYADRKNRNPKRIAGTCEWLTQNTIFRNWSNPGRSNLLWITANPGCGKSVLARYLIDEAFEDLYDASELSLCYFFFRDDFKDQRRVSYALCSLLRQLLMQCPKALTEELLSLYTGTGTELLESFSFLWEALVRASQVVHDKTIICVLDALDECDTGDCHTLLQAIQDLYADDRSPAKFKLLVTSRAYGYITDVFKPILTDQTRIDFESGREDGTSVLDGEIDTVIKYRIHTLAQLRELTSNEQSLLLKRFTSVQHRTYLWAHLTLSLFEEAQELTLDSIIRMLETLPTTVDQAYEKILVTRAKGNGARLILSLIIAAVRPITLEELAIAFKITADDAEWRLFSHRLEPSKRFHSTIRDICGLFVIVVNGRVYLLHSTARQFLLQETPVDTSTKPSESQSHIEKEPKQSKWLWKASFKLRHCHALLAERCLWYLNMEYATSTSWTAYCMENWQIHLSKSSLDRRDSATKLAVEWCRGWEDASTLEKAASFGLLGVVQRLFHPSFRRKYDTREVSAALWVAARDGQEPLAKLLIKHGAEPDTDKYGGLSSTGEDRALHIAVRSSNLDVLETLLLFEANPNIPGIQDKSALHVAAQHGHLEAVKMLLRYRADPKSLDRNGRTPCAMFYRSHRSRGPCPNRKFAQDAFQLLNGAFEIFNVPWTRNVPIPLYEAVDVPCVSCVENILRKSTRIDRSSVHLAQLLHTIVARRSAPLATLFYQYGPFEYTFDGRGRTPCHAALDMNAKQVLKIMLQNGADVNMVSQDGLPLLVYEIYRRFKNDQSESSIIELLLSNRADVNAVFNFCTPLYWSVQRRDVRATELLIKAHARIERGESVSEWNGTWWGHLLSGLADKDKNYRKYGTPASNTAVEIAELFLHNGYNPQDLASLGTNFLHACCEKRALALVELLLDHRMDVNSLDSQQRTPLMRVLPSNNWWDGFYNTPNLITLLLERGANVSIQNLNGDTALSIAKKQQRILTMHQNSSLLGFGLVVRLLEEAERKYIIESAK